MLKRLHLGQKRDSAELDSDTSSASSTLSSSASCLVSSPTSPTLRPGPPLIRAYSTNTLHDLADLHKQSRGLHATAQHGKSRPRSKADPAPVLRRADSTVTRQQAALAARPSCAIIEETARVFSTLQPDSPEDQEVHSWVEQGIRFHERGDIEMATDYFRRAATYTHTHTQPQPLALFLYGISLRHGWGCRPNEQLAFQYLQKAAEVALVGIEEQPERKSELVMAIYELAVSFSHGWGVLKSKETAVFFYKVAADLGDPDAQNDLAHCYKSGFGAKKDMRLAAHYFRLAEAQGRGIVGNSWIHKDKYK